MFTAQVENADSFASFWRNRVVRIVQDGLRHAVDTAAREGAQEAITRHVYHDRTGNLTRSIGSITGVSGARDDFAAEIVALESYASYVEGGTRAHVIEARRVSMLRFTNQSGETVFRARVNHPGTQAAPFMSFAYFKAERVLVREVELAVSRAQGALDS